MEEKEYILREVQNSPGQYMMFCPGCESGHSVWTEAPNAHNGAKWGFDGNMEKPTFTPSLLVRWGDEKGDHVCHSFIKNGVWEFLGDCTHKLAGQKVEMIPF